MKKLTLTVTVLVGLVSAIPAYAQSMKTNFHFTIGGTLVPTAQQGGDAVIGRVDHYDQKINSGQGVFTATNLVSSEALVVKLPSHVWRGNFFAGYQTDSGWGALGEYSRYSAQGAELSGTVVQTSALADVLKMWPDQDIRPLVYASDGQTVNYGTQPYSASASMKLNRWSGLVTYPVYFAQGRMTFLAGVTGVSSQNMRAESTKQAVNVRDNYGYVVHEDWATATTGSSKYSGFGPTVGISGELCVHSTAETVLAIRVDGRASVLSRGKLEEVGSFERTEDASLISPTGANLARLFNFSNSSPLTIGSTTARPTAMDGGVSLRLYYKSMELSGGFTISRYSSLPTAPTWEIPQAAAPIYGGWKSNITNLTLSGVTLGVTFRF